MESSLIINKAYLILAHKNLDHLIRLIKKLDDDNSWFFIHVDLNTPINQFEEKLIANPKVKLIERIATKWGSYSLAKATLNALREVKRSNLDFHHISLLSGQDYPIKSNPKIDQFFATSDYKVFLDHFPLPNYVRWKSGGAYRYNKYFFGTSPGWSFLSKATNLLSTLIPILGRKIPSGLKPYCGSQWWTIDMYALHYILDYTEQNPGYLQFHKYTFAPDELFFHMILLNAEDEKLKQSIYNNNMMYMKWLALDNPHPQVLTKEDFTHIRASPALFARKFDADKDTKILELIDAYALS